MAKTLSERVSALETAVVGLFKRNEETSERLEKMEKDLAGLQTYLTHVFDRMTTHMTKQDATLDKIDARLDDLMKR